MVPDLIVKEIANQTQYAPKHYNIGMNEEWVIFKNAVKTRIFTPHVAEIYMNSDALHVPGMVENSLELGMLWLEASGEVMFRQAMHPYDLHLEAAMTREIRVQGSQRVGRGGPLDQRRFWGIEYLEETPDCDIDDAFIDRLTKAMPVAVADEPIVTPAVRYKTMTMIVGGFQMKTSLLIDVLDRLGAKTLNTVSTTENPIEAAKLSTKLTKIQTLWNLVAGVSGEFKPGDVVFNGVDSKGGKGSFDTVTIGLSVPEVEILNPFRAEFGADDTLGVEDEESIQERLLPKGQSKVKFVAQDGQMTAETLPMVKWINMA